MSKSWNIYLEENKRKFLDELQGLLRIPSISTSAEYKNDMLTCAELVKQRLLESGCDMAKIIDTNGHPVVYGEKVIDPEKPTVLVYGHYDVQPPDPLEHWDSPPFEPTIRNGKIFARGAADDKGQFYMHLKALEILNESNSLVTNIKFLIEGEEEIGSPNLNTFIKKNKDLLRADVILISDSEILNKETPSLETGFRGVSLLELEIKGADKDLHSGTYGGAIPNPITIISRIIASLHDENNHIVVPGFYDHVLSLSDEDRKSLSSFPFDEEEYRKEIGIKNTNGEKGYNTLERTGIRPTIEVNGIWGGYQGEGIKTVIPAKAGVKISARLVPNQSSVEITEKLCNYLISIVPDSVELKIKTYSGSEPYSISETSPGYIAASKAFEKVFGKKPVPVRNGGSLPVCYMMEKELGIKSVLLGFGLPQDNIHAPNENFDIDNYFKGIESILHFHYFFNSLFDPHTN